MPMFLMSLAMADPVLDVEGERRLIEALQQAVEDAEALGRAAGMAQNALPPRLDPKCVPEQVQNVTTTVAFTDAWGASLVDVERFNAALLASATLPTLVPLRGSATAELREQLTDRWNRTREAYQGAHRALVARTGTYLTRCQAKWTAAAGWKRAGVVARDDPPDLRAVWIRQRGFLCTSGSTPVAPGPVLLEQPETCWSETEACGCTRTEVFAGTVL